jgi:transcriptional regulator with PAS, ATPase and Fis domain
LLESELFGFDRGAFSGADHSKPGLFEMAHQGTMFLDEIGELDIRLQAKLLRALDGMSYYRIGGTKKVSADVRVVAATNQDLRAAVEAGRFRADLYHRLNQFTLRVPPLRERIDDIRVLAQHFLEQTGLGQSLTEEAMQTLESQPWPGNIRELRNVITSASLCALGNEITGQDIFKESQGMSSPLPLKPVTPDLEAVEQSAIRDALASTQGHRQRAAEQLGISRRTLHRKLKRYGGEMAGVNR